MPQHEALSLAETYISKAQQETDPAGRATYWGTARYYFKQAGQWGMVAWCFQQEN